MDSQQVTVTGLIDVCITLELPKSKTKLKVLAKKLERDNANVEGIAKDLVLEAIRLALDAMPHNEGGGSDVSERDLDVEIE